MKITNYSIGLFLNVLNLIKLSSSFNRLLERQIEIGGEDLVPFYQLLEGGREGQFFANLEDYFYYSQLRRFSLKLFFLHVYKSYRKGPFVYFIHYTFHNALYYPAKVSTRWILEKCQRRFRFQKSHL